MTSNTCRYIHILVNSIAIGLITCNYIPAANAQPSPAEPAQSTPELTQAPSYIGFGGVIGLQGGTTSLSQGTFSILTKQVLTKNLAIHNANTIFGSLTPSASVALTYNRPMSSGEGIPIVFTPFVGAGIMTHYDNGMIVSPHLTGGIDVSTPFKLTGTLRINAGFVRDRQADLGVLFGIGFSN